MLVVATLVVVLDQITKALGDATKLGGQVALAAAGVRGLGRVAVARTGLDLAATSGVEGGVLSATKRRWPAKNP